MLSSTVLKTNASTKHCWTISPIAPGYVITEQDITDCCCYVATQLGPAALKISEQKVVNGNLLIMCFTKPTKLRLDTFSTLTVECHRFKYSKLYDQILTFALNL